MSATVLPFRHKPLTFQPRVVAGTSDWIEWQGGRSPVPGKTLVQVRLRSGTTSPAVWAAELVWQHGMFGISSDDIVAYRVFSDGPGEAA